jgi:hypothetical protein
MAKIRLIASYIFIHDEKKGPTKINLDLARTAGLTIGTCAKMGSVSLQHSGEHASQDAWAD